MDGAEIVRRDHGTSRVLHRRSRSCHRHGQKQVASSACFVSAVPMTRHLAKPTVGAHIY